MQCIACGDTGIIKAPPQLPPNVNRHNHTWEQIRALATSPEDFACHKCWRGQMMQVERKLVPFNFS